MQGFPSSRPVNLFILIIIRFCSFCSPLVGEYPGSLPPCVGLPIPTYFSKFPPRFRTLFPPADHLKFGLMNWLVSVKYSDFLCYGSSSLGIIQCSTNIPPLTSSLRIRPAIGYVAPSNYLVPSYPSEIMPVLFFPRVPP